MRISSYLSLGSFVPTVLAQSMVTNTMNSTTSIKEYCMTTLASTSQHIIPKVIISEVLAPEFVELSGYTSTPVSTKTDRRLLHTANKTIDRLTTVVTTDLKPTDTYISTETLIKTTTESTVTYINATSTLDDTTTSIATIIVPTPDNFENIQHSSNDTTLGHAIPLNQSLEAKPESFPQKSFPSGGQNGSDLIFPDAITCRSYHRIYYTLGITSVVPTSTTTVHLPNAKTTTSTITNLDTTTSTIALNARVTETTTQTLTVATAVASSTVTVEPTLLIERKQTTTIKEACRPTNVLGPQLNNTSLLTNDYLFHNDTTKVTVGGADDPYECCVVCYQSEGCEYSRFSSKEKLCQNYIKADSRTCDNRAYVGVFFRTESLDFDQDDVFPSYYSNGPCGVLADGGHE
ncbi:uncharacterized protein KY384_008640 [Bacidia gigantensis]|uniref:uncharacterized protein n=1 Tax=Bacidia gigantensis TaxID=2732470 RepID=UPI001D037FA4|nr:uncharacterized protein KY384_008640 [Bacidia gigantensis]KAG8527210.1 hypothetical protein KY384_008640 [Bacidia gigantensis]